MKRRTLWDAAFAHWVPFEHNHLGFFTIYRR